MSDRIADIRAKAADLRRQAVELAYWEDLHERGVLAKLLESARNDLEDARSKYGLIDLSAPHGLLMVAKVQGVEEHARQMVDFLSSVKIRKKDLDSQIRNCEDEIIRLDSSRNKGDRA